MLKKIISGVLALTLVFGATGLTGGDLFSEQAVITATAETYGDYEYEVLSDGTIEIMGYTGEDTELNIPSTISGKLVTSIGSGAFNGCESITSIDIPIYVNSIRNYAFSGCTKLKSVNLPECLTEIGDYAFSSCIALTDITIPNNVTTIRPFAFSGCVSLESINIPYRVSSIGDFAFQYCDGLKSVTISNGVESIGHAAFWHCENLESVTIPNSVENFCTCGGCIFEGSNNLTVYCHADSVAEKYAIENDIDHVLLVGNGIEINKENFPDKKFREWYVVWRDTDHDGYLSDEEIANATVCNFQDAGYEIETVKGIEYFTELTWFVIQYGDEITEVDLSKNTKLEYVSFIDCNNITKIILGNHPDLTSFGCKGTKITEIDLTTSAKLNYLDVSATSLTELDISGNPKLERLYAQWNGITELDISNNEYLLKAYTEPTEISDWGVGTVMYKYEDDDANYVLCLDDSVNIITEKPSASGTITVAGEKDTTGVDITLTGADKKPYTAQVSADGTFSLPALSDGSYTLTASKDGYVPHDYAVTIKNGAPTTNISVELKRPGDISGDGKITAVDSAMVNAYVMKTGKLDDYDQKVADVIGNDGSVTAVDCSRINAHVQKTNLLW